MRGPGRIELRRHGGIGPGDAVVDPYDQKADFGAVQNGRQLLALEVQHAKLSVERVESTLVLADARHETREFALVEQSGGDQIGVVAQGALELSCVPVCAVSGSKEGQDAKGLGSATYRAQYRRSPFDLQAGRWRRRCGRERGRRRFCAERLHKTDLARHF